LPLSALLIGPFDAKIHRWLVPPLHGQRTIRAPFARLEFETAKQRLRLVCFIWPDSGSISHRCAPNGVRHLRGSSLRMTDPADNTHNSQDFNYPGVDYMEISSLPGLTR